MRTSSENLDLLSNLREDLPHQPENQIANVLASIRKFNKSSIENDILIRE